jgi:hypothetical protein
MAIKRKLIQRRLDAMQLPAEAIEEYARGEAYDGRGHEGPAVSRLPHQGYELLMQLIDGHAHFADDLPEDVLRAAWRSSRKTFVAAWRHLPGRRPAAFWKFENLPGWNPSVYHTEAQKLAYLKSHPQLLTADEATAFAKKKPRPEAGR